MLFIILKLHVCNKKRTLMKIIITLLLSFITLISYGKKHEAYSKLCEVNKCWTEQSDVSGLQYPAYSEVQGEHEWIRTHLKLVEQTLRVRSTTHLTAAQQANRLAALDHLNEYWHAGNFPINDRYNVRTPIFIDPYDNFCAVGYLVKATGNEGVSRMIAAKTNLAYVREMNYPELSAWAKDYGFTVDELAWIQPGYPPVTSVAKIGKGTDGEVHQLAVSNDGEKLYVGGVFTKVDDKISTDNIAYVTYTNDTYDWHAMGTGVNGPVYAIAEFDGKVFVAGSFTEAGGVSVNNVAYWDGNNWNAAGCITGTVKDFIIYKSKLYAVGGFDVCAALAEVNVAVWGGSMWQQIPGLTGHVNTAYAEDNYLVFGGKFSYQNEGLNIIKWSPDNGFAKFNSGIDNEVNDIHEHNGDIYVALSGDIDTTVLVRKFNISTGDWDVLSHPVMFGDDKLAIYSFCTVNDHLFAAGDIRYTPMMGTGTLNCIEVGDTSLYPGDAFGLDSAIYTMVNYKGKFVAGGKFNKGSAGWQYETVNSIAIQASAVNIKVTGSEGRVGFEVYPNPVNNSEITVENDFNATDITVTDIQGRVVATLPLKQATKQQVTLPELYMGTYILKLTNDTGTTATQRISIVK